jgi:hypothetical protein
MVLQLGNFAKTSKGKTTFKSAEWKKERGELRVARRPAGWLETGELPVKNSRRIAQRLHSASFSMITHSVASSFC